MKRLRTFFWRLLHPREARLLQQERNLADAEQATSYFQEAIDGIAVLRASEDTWHRVASDQGSTTEALQRVIAEEAHAYDEAMDTARMVDEFPRTEFENTLERLECWRVDFMAAIAAHPNVTVDVLSTLEMQKEVVTRVLGNPVLSFLLLERPDFLEALDKEHPIVGRKPDKQFEFARHALLQEKLPPALVTMLRGSPSFWLALEAQTHIAAEGFSASLLDLEWLEAQIIEKLRSDTPPRRCLMYELACYGFLPRTIVPVAPWQTADSDTRTQAATHPDVMELIQKTHQLAWQKPHERERLLLQEIRKRKYDWKDGNALALHLEAALFHPEAAPWVSECIAEGWPHSQKQGGISSLYRLMTIAQGKASAEVAAAHKALAIGNAFEHWGELERFTYNSPGILYFMTRDLPGILEGDRLGKPYRNLDSSAPIEIKILPFLLRLAITFRLDDTEPVHQKWREILRHDPNRYVRAAARKEIVWPK